MKTKRPMTPILDGSAVAEALRSAHARGDIETMRRICGNTPDDVLTMIGNGDLEIRGDSTTRFEVYTVDREYLVPTRLDTREPVPDNERVEVTGKPERTIEKVEMGMLRNMGDDWFIDRVKAPGKPYTPAEEKPARLDAAALGAMPVGAVVYVASVLVPRVPYKRTRKGWQTFSPSSGRANGAPLTSETIAERGAWTR